MPDFAQIIIHVLDWNGCHKQDWLFICPIRLK